MGAFLEKPKTEKVESSGSGHDLKWGVSAMQGWRLEMEDAHTCETDLHKLKGWSFFAVFDGHAGSKVSEYCSKYLLNILMERLTEKDGEDVEKMKDKIKLGFLEVDERLQKQQKAGKGQDDRGGTTAISCLVSPTKFIWANCGDSRGLLCREGNLSYCTVDHKPFNEKERSRIEKAGGQVMMQRVNGSLAVSRALGDFDFKRADDKKQNEQLVSPEPEVDIIERSEHDQFLLIACDGVFDVMSNEEIVKFVLHHLELESNLSKICSDLIDTCLNKNSRDNMSVILVTFPDAPKVSDEAIKKDKQVKVNLRQQIVETLDQIAKETNNPIDMEENYVIQQLNTKFSTDYPEIYSEREFITTEIQAVKVKKFGPDANNFSGTESSYQQVHPPPELLLGPSPGVPVDLDMHDPPPIPMEVEPPEIGGDAALSVPATDTPTDQQHVPT